MAPPAAEAPAAKAKAVAWAFIAVGVNFTAIITCPFDFIGQKRIGSRDFLELALNLPVARIEVRVQFLCAPAIGALDLGVAGIA